MRRLVLRECALGFLEYTRKYELDSLAVVGCIAVFGYQYYLEGAAKKKAAQVVAAQNQIDQTTVTEFIRLRDRFSAAKSILGHQIALSQFFDVLEALTLQSVSYSSLRLSVTEDRRAQIDLSGTARSFNALAAQSSTYAADKRIKRAIFSNINASATTGLVSFNLTAELDPSLVERSAKVAAPPVEAPAEPEAPVATTTATTTP